MCLCLLHLNLFLWLLLHLWCQAASPGSVCCSWKFSTSAREMRQESSQREFCKECFHSSMTCDLWVIKESSKILYQKEYGGRVHKTGRKRNKECSLNIAFFRSLMGVWSQRQNLYDLHFLFLFVCFRFFSWNIKPWWFYQFLVYSPAIYSQSTKSYTVLGLLGIIFLISISIKSTSKGKRERLGVQFDGLSKRSTRGNMCMFPDKLQTHRQINYILPD